jgi:hypothetical protein
MQYVQGFNCISHFFSALRHRQCDIGDANADLRSFRITAVWQAIFNHITNSNNSKKRSMPKEKVCVQTCVQSRAESASGFALRFVLTARFFEQGYSYFVLAYCRDSSFI